MSAMYAIRLFSLLGCVRLTPFFCNARREMSVILKGADLFSSVEKNLTFEHATAAMTYCHQDTFSASRINEISDYR
jgi:hypothetical protein